MHHACMISLGLAVSDTHSTTYFDLGSMSISISVRVVTGAEC